MMKLDRRGVLAVLPALLVAGRTDAQQQSPALPDGPPDQSAFQAQMAPLWDQLAVLPHIRQPALEQASAGICYMFTNKDCEVCQLVHKEYPQGYRRLEMRYVIYPWPGEPFDELNHMYRPETTLAEFQAYMAHRLDIRSSNASSAQGDLIMAVAGEIAKELVDGGSFGTPFFFVGAPGPGGKLSYTAGDIVAMAGFLDSAA